MTGPRLIASREKPATGTLVLESTPTVPDEPESVADHPLVRFDAFTVEYRVYGWVRLSAARLTDFLNAHDDVELVNAQVEAHAAEDAQRIDGLVIHRSDVVAVRAGEPRGDPSMRQRARTHPLRVAIGPYRLGGYLHATPGVDPLAELAARPPFVPLSLAWLELWRGAQRVGQWPGTILFNRLLAQAIEVVPEEAIALEP
jgi:hypothetical protein